MGPPFPREQATFARRPEAKLWVIAGKDVRHGVVGHFFEESLVRTAMEAAIAIVSSDDASRGRIARWSIPSHPALVLRVEIALPVDLGGDLGEHLPLLPRIPSMRRR